MSVQQVSSNSPDNSLFIVEGDGVPAAFDDYETAEVREGLLVCLNLAELLDLTKDYRVTFVHKVGKHTKLVLTDRVPVE